MANFTVRNFDDAAYQKLKERAVLNHRSLEAEVRTVLALSLAKDHAMKDRAKLIQRIDATRESIKPSGLDLVAALREDRDRSVM